MGLSDLVKKATGAPTPEKTRSSSISYGRPSLEQDSVDKGAEGDDVSVLDEKEGNVILAMISQRSSAYLCVVRTSQTSSRMAQGWVGQWWLLPPAAGSRPPPRVGRRHLTRV